MGKITNSIEEIVFKGIEKLYSNKNLDSSSVILCYHSIAGDNWNFSTSKKEFQKQVSWLSENKKVVSLSEILKTKKKNQVAITFDDGFENNIKNALPILEKVGAVATVFIVKDYVGEVIDNKKYLSVHQIKKLKEKGWEIGFHTKSHKFLPDLNTDVLNIEIKDGKKELENLLGFKIKFFAYPMGGYDQNVLDIVRKERFSAAFTVDGGELDKKDKYLINRVTVRNNLSLNEFKSLLTKTGLIFNKFESKMLKIKDNIFKSKSRNNIGSLSDSKSSDSKKRIIISTYDDIKNPYYRGGGAIAIHEIAKRLSEKYNVTVLSWSHSKVLKEEIDGVKYQRIGHKSVGPRIAMLLFQIILPILTLIKKYDVWIESFGPPFTTSMLPVFTKKKVVGVVHMLAAEDMERKYKLPFKIVEKFGIKMYKNIIVTNEYTLRKVRNVNKKAKITVISNGVSKVKKPKLNKSNYILYLGRIEIDQKGLDLLLESYKFLQETNVLNHKLVIAGSGTESEMKKLNRLIKKNNLKKFVEFKGWVSGKDKDKLMSNAKIMVIPSRYETFSMVALEAMAFGLPIVCYDIHGLKWVSEKSSKKVMSFDTKKFALTISNLLNNKAELKRLSEYGLMYANNFTWEVVSENYKNYLSKVIKYA